ncbi:hypothetical protein VTO42DRAFT_682 [Malbranchea cinnamomea]
MMASNPVLQDPKPDSMQQEERNENEILSDEQIQALLQEAETRLRGSTTSEDSDKQVVSLDAVSESYTGPKIPRLNSDKTLKPYVREVNGVATIDKAKTVPEKIKKLSETIRTVEKQEPKKSKEKPTAGPQWFHLPKTVMTPELKRDLQILRMRSVLDPKRHYKKESGKAKPPAYSQVGTIIEGPTEFFSARIPKKERKKTFVEEVLAVEAEHGRFKRKYGEIQAAKTSGKKAYYKAKQAKRARKR